MKEPFLTRSDMFLRLNVSDRPINDRFGTCRNMSERISDAISGYNLHDNTIKLNIFTKNLGAYPGGARGRPHPPKFKK